MTEEISSLDLVATLSSVYFGHANYDFVPNAMGNKLKEAIEKCRNYRIEYANDSLAWTSDASYAGLVPIDAIGRITLGLSNAGKRKRSCFRCSKITGWHYHSAKWPGCFRERSRSRDSKYWCYTPGWCRSLG